VLLALFSHLNVELRLPVSHVAPPPARVPALIRDLFEWLRVTDTPECCATVAGGLRAPKRRTVQDRRVKPPDRPPPPDC